MKFRSHMKKSKEFKNEIKDKKQQAYIINFQNLKTNPHLIFLLELTKLFLTSSVCLVRLSLKQVFETTYILRKFCIFLTSNVIRYLYRMFCLVVDLSNRMKPFIPVTSVTAVVQCKQTKAVLNNNFLLRTIKK